MTKLRPSPEMAAGFVNAALAVQASPFDYPQGKRSLLP
jgi:hypothetical protein